MRSQIESPRMNPLAFISSVIVGIAFISACGSSYSGSADLNAVRTEAVSTFAFSLTGTLAPVPTISPTFTSLPTFTPAVSPQVTSTVGTQRSCYNLLWIEDRTIPDGTLLKANQVFTKTWLVQNNGECAWAPGFTFSHIGGDSMRGRTVTLRDPIPVGAKRELSVELAVPAGVTGLVQSSWRMADAGGNFFGDTLSVNIIVGDGQDATATGTP